MALLLGLHQEAKHVTERRRVAEDVDDVDTDGDDDDSHFPGASSKIARAMRQSYIFFKMQSPLEVFTPIY